MIQRREFLYLYDLKMVNPNGDPDNNAPRIDPVTQKCYVTDVRLKRYIRDLLAARYGEDAILVTRLGGEPVTLQKRVEAKFGKKVKGDPTTALCETFIDLRLFGSPLAFNLGKDKASEAKGEKKMQSLVGPVQIRFGESLHPVEAVTVRGTSTMASKDGNDAGTYTDITVLPYAVIGFHGIVNENAARHTHLTEEDVTLFMDCLWKSVRESPSANTRSKTGQQPLMLLDIAYKPGTEYHIGRLPDLLDVATGSQPVRGPDDYTIGFATLRGDLAAAADKIDRITVTVSPTFARRNPAALTEFASLLPDGRVTVTVA